MEPRRGGVHLLPGVAAPESPATLQDQLYASSGSPRGRCLWPSSQPAILETQEQCLPSDPDQTSPRDTDTSFSQALAHPRAQEAEFCLARLESHFCF